MTKGPYRVRKTGGGWWQILFNDESVITTGVKDYADDLCDLLNYVRHERESENENKTSSN